MTNIAKDTNRHGLKNLAMLRSMKVLVGISRPLKSVQIDTAFQKAWMDGILPTQLASRSIGAKKVLPMPFRRRCLGDMIRDPLIL